MHNSDRKNIKSMVLVCVSVCVFPLRVSALQLLGSSSSDLLRALAPTSAAHRPRGGETYSALTEEARDRNG